MKIEHIKFSEYLKCPGVGGLWITHSDTLLHSFHEQGPRAQMVLTVNHVPAFY